MLCDQDPVFKFSESSGGGGGSGADSTWSSPSPLDEPSAFSEEAYLLAATAGSVVGEGEKAAAAMSGAAV